MINTNHQHDICMKCGKEQKGRDKDTSECECGSRNFILMDTVFAY